jgi:hypothetical protein
VLNVVTGADAEIDSALEGDERVRKVCFTGSVAGGNDPALVAVRPSVPVRRGRRWTLHDPRHHPARPRPAGYPGGNVLRPSLVLDPRDDACLVVEEQFGPTLPGVDRAAMSPSASRALVRWACMARSAFSGPCAQTASMMARCSGRDTAGAADLGDLDRLLDRDLPDAGATVRQLHQARWPGGSARCGVRTGWWRTARPARSRGPGQALQTLSTIMKAILTTILNSSRHG